MKNEICKKHGLTMKFEFVPWSQSRNKKDKPKVDDYSMNWKVYLYHKDRLVLTTDYMAGIGHCKRELVNKSMRYCIADADAIIKECETGKYYAGSKWRDSVPDEDDVMYCLAMNADALEYRNFEDWASEFGYDEDSRKAETIYRACLEIALALRSALGDTKSAQLREDFQDY